MFLSLFTLNCSTFAGQTAQLTESAKAWKDCSLRASCECFKETVKQIECGKKEIIINKKGELTVKKKSIGFVAPKSQKNTRQLE